MSWEVTVRLDGDDILTIGSAYLAGVSEPFSPAQEQAIREAGRHLLAFIGTGEPMVCFICQGVEDGCPICDPQAEGFVEAEFERRGEPCP